MRVYRGPNSSELYDDYKFRIINEGHEIVDNIDLSKDSDLWVGEKTIRINITKSPDLRKAVAHIILNENDVVALYQGLMKGLLKDLQEKRELFKIAKDIFNSFGQKSGLASLVPFEELINQAKEEEIADLKKGIELFFDKVRQFEAKPIEEN